MSNNRYSSDLIDDILFRVGEKRGSDFDGAALRYLNRAYQSVWLGGSEFGISLNDPWWWLKTEGSFILSSPITTGTVDLTNGSATATLSADPGTVTNWFFKASHANVFRVSSNTTVTLTLDQPYTGATNAADSYKLFRLEYDLPSGAIKILDPMNASMDNQYEITADSLANIEYDYPLNLSESGVPSKYAMVNERTLRFNRHSTVDATNAVRVDFNYLQKPADLTDSDTEEPLVPFEYRRVLADIAVFWLWIDKNDDRAVVTGESIKALLQAMSNENRARWASWGGYAQINTRKYRQRPLRTESGLIIG